MLPDVYRWIEAQFEPDDDPSPLFAIAEELVAADNLPGAATVLDRAYGLDPRQVNVATLRAQVLDRLALTEHGLHFRYIPGGCFLMGNPHGEADEQPVHPVWLEPYWLTDTPISWADYGRLLGWPGDDNYSPVIPENAIIGDDWAFYLTERLCWLYSDTGILNARDGIESIEPGTVRFTEKPMVGLGWPHIELLLNYLNTSTPRYALPTEAQWEKAARSGLIGQRYPWGDAPPSEEHCDADRFQKFGIQPMRSLPPNSYGLYAMSGGVWEWTRDWYDAQAYAEHKLREPTGPPTGAQKVLRGGSWADCAEAVTVSYRMGIEVGGEDDRWHAGTPTIGFRLCRRA